MDKIYPELVIRDEAGKIQGVRYDELAPMLLKEMQQQRMQMTRKIDSQAAKINSSHSVNPGPWNPRHRAGDSCL